MQRCRKLLIRLTSSRPKRHYRHLKLHKPSSSSSGRKATRVVSAFFLTFQKKKQKKEKMKRLNELRSFSDSVSDKKAESRKKGFPSSLTTSCIGQGKKAHSQKVSQDLDAPRDSTSAFLPWLGEKIICIAFQLDMWCGRCRISLSVNTSFTISEFVMNAKLILCSADLMRMIQKYIYERRLWIGTRNDCSTRIQIIFQTKEKIDINVFVYIYP